MLEAARGWLTPAVLFVLVNLVVATIAVASRLMSSPAPAQPGDERRGLLRAPSFAAVDRLRASFSFSRLGLAADHAPAFDSDHAAAEAEQSPSPSPSPSAEAGRPAEVDVAHEAEEQARVERSRSEAAAEAPGKRRPRARRARKAAAAAATEGPAAAAADGPEATAREATTGRGARRVERGREEPVAVEVDARADDFIRRFREQLQLQRLDSLLRRTRTA